MADVAERILVACALKKEARGLRQHWRREWRLTVTGLGADRTVRALDAELDRQRPELLIFTGMAGQLDPGLTLGEVIATDDPSVPLGAVITADPKQGTSVAKGSKVDLRVSAGPAPIPVPDLVTQRLDAALAALNDSGLRPQIAE
ncbi:MAG TPA: PASTA domain-containing protein, partial [Acidobacteriota bacterium]|nr:PASTA domain-containing protein [Acidobacteriota bacterium]